MPGENCPRVQCSGEQYLSSQSDYSKSMSQSVSIKYGQGSVSGQVYTDRVFLTSSASGYSKDFYFVAVNKASNLDGLVSDGLIGLSPGNSESANGNFMKQLVAGGVVDSTVFALQLEQDYLQSKMWLGGYPISAVKAALGDATLTDAQAEAKIDWVSVGSSTYWQSTLGKVTAGNNEMTPRLRKVIVDSGASLCHIPTSDYSNLIKLISQGKTGC